ncbi:MAG: hypothetical protein AB7P99_06910 [Vicinamibacterales bacterium]
MQLHPQLITPQVAKALLDARPRHELAAEVFLDGSHRRASNVLGLLVGLGSRHHGQ